MSTENSNINPDENTLPPETSEQINRGFWDLVYGLSDFVRRIFDLQSDLDREGTIINIKNNKRMQGANVWLLVCSIMVASIGLDLNSPAVIIGAMLISPLMSPILGVGLAVGINDKETLFTSLRHFGIAIFIALFTSFIYFSITPLGEMTNEINARTSPTLLDAFVAVFGGLAGIVSASRKDKSNAIPGVAIATALMPPLCVAGFGLASGKWGIFANSFYLFFLNSVFIALTTYFIVRFMRFPLASYVNKRDKTRTTTIIAIFSLLIILPSAWILFGVVKDLQLKSEVKYFMENKFNTEDRSYLNHEIRTKDTISYVKVEYYSKNNIPITQEEIEAYQEELKICGLGYPILLPRSTSNAQALLDKEFKDKQEEQSNQIKSFLEREKEKNDEIQRLIAEKDSIQNARTMTTIVEEAKIFVPNLKDIDLVQSRFDDIPILLVKWEDDAYDSSFEKKRLYDFVKIKTGMDTLVVY